MKKTEKKVVKEIVPTGIREFMRMTEEWQDAIIIDKFGKVILNECYRSKLDDSSLKNFQDEFKYYYVNKISLWHDL